MKVGEEKTMLDILRRGLRFLSLPPHPPTHDNNKQGVLGGQYDNVSGLFSALVLIFLVSLITFLQRAGHYCYNEIFRVFLFIIITTYSFPFFLPLLRADYLFNIETSFVFVTFSTLLFIQLYVIQCWFEGIHFPFIKYRANIAVGLF